LIKAISHSLPRCTCKVNKSQLISLSFQLRRIAEFRKEHEKLLKQLLPQDEKKAFVEGNVVNVLTNKDHLNRRVLVVNSGKVWEPDQVSADQLFRLFYLGESYLDWR
jgi:hypothetical protein